MTTRTRRPSTRRKAARPPARSTCRALVPLDTAHIRKAELKKLDRAQKTHGDLETQWNHFVEVEQKAYVGWVRSQCGPVLEDCRKLQEEIGLMLRTFDLADDLKAYYPRRRLHECVAAAGLFFEKGGKPPAGFESFFEIEDSDEQDGEDDRCVDPCDGGGADGNPFGDPFDGMADDDMDAAKSLLESLFGTALQPEDAPHRRKAIKSLYRKIAQRLHPDQGGDGDVRQIELWHAAQRAYEDHDLEALEHLHAQCDLLDTDSAVKAPVSSIKAGLAYFKSACTSLRRQLRLARKSEEWGFLAWQDGKRERHRKAVVAMVERERARLEHERHHLAGELDRLLTPPELRRRKRPAARRAAGKSRPATSKSAGNTTRQASREPPSATQDRDAGQSCFEFF